MIPRADERPKTIALKCDGPYDEGRAVMPGSDPLDICGPGHLIEAVESEDAARLPIFVQKQNTAGENCVLRIALEDRLGGKGPTYRGGRELIELYNEDDIVPFRVLLPGDIAFVRVAPLAEITHGTKLQSAGDGTFVAQSGGGTALMEAAETVDYSDEEDTEAEQFIRAMAI